MDIQLKLKNKTSRHLSRKMKTQLWQNIFQQKGRSLLQILIEQSRTKLWFFKLVYFELSLHCKATVDNAPLSPLLQCCTAISQLLCI